MTTFDGPRNPGLPDLNFDAVTQWTRDIDTTDADDEPDEPDEDDMPGLIRLGGIVAAAVAVALVAVLAAAVLLPFIV